MKTALLLAEKAGRIMRKNFGLAMKKEWKDHRSPVTETDLAINTMVLKAIKKKYPDHSILAEEGDDFSEASEYVWICDPVDGTYNFAHGIPTATFALALTHNGEPILSVILDPFLNRMFTAEKGKGAYCNEQKLSVSATPLLHAIIGWETKMETPEDIMRHEGLRSRAIFFKTISAGWEFAMVAAGKLEGRICFNPWGKDYDFAPGTLLVSEAGGMVANIGATTYDYRNLNFIAANTAVYRELTKGDGALFPAKTVDNAQ